MTDYRREANCIIRLSDGAGIPLDPANADYQRFLAWAEDHDPTPDLDDTDHTWE